MPIESKDVRALVNASREAAHAACNLAATAALLAKARPHAQTAWPLAMDASISAANAAFVLDDVYRRQNGSDASLEAAERAMEAAAQALSAAHAALRQSRAPPQPA